MDIIIRHHTTTCLFCSQSKGCFCLAHDVSSEIVQILKYLVAPNKRHFYVIETISAEHFNWKGQYNEISTAACVADMDGSWDRRPLLCPAFVAVSRISLLLHNNHIIISRKVRDEKEETQGWYDMRQSTSTEKL